MELFAWDKMATVRSGVKINWRDVQRKNVVNSVDRSSLRVPWPNVPYKRQTHKTAQKRAEKQDVTLIQDKLFLCVLDTIHC